MVICLCSVQGGLPSPPCACVGFRHMTDLPKVMCSNYVSYTCTVVCAHNNCKILNYFDSFLFRTHIVHLQVEIPSAVT